jgi:hypothetical protein
MDFLQISVNGRVSLSLWGKIVGETRTTVRFRLQDDTCVDIDKSAIREVIDNSKFLNR